MVEKKITRRISSSGTVVHTKIMPAVLSVAAVTYLILLLFSKYSAEELLPLLIATIMFSIAWFVKGRNFKVVYLENDGLIVDGKKILFKDMVSIKKDLSSHYYIRYLEGVKYKSFKFIVPSFLFITPAYMKQIKRMIDKNDNNTDGVSLL